MQTEGVTPAELKTTRESMGLTSEWVAEAAGVAVRTVRHWESGATRVPDDVAGRLEELTRQLSEHVASLLESVADGRVTLLRYRDQTALQHSTGLTWPVATHAIAQLRAIEQLRARGARARMIWFNPDEYQVWAAAREAPSPQAWADLQPWDPGS